MIYHADFYYLLAIAATIGGGNGGRYEMPVRDHPGTSRWIRLSNFQARRITVPCPLHPDSGTKADIAGGRRSAKPGSRHDATSGFKLVERSVLLV